MQVIAQLPVFRLVLFCQGFHGHKIAPAVAVVLSENIVGVTDFIVGIQPSRFKNPVQGWNPLRIIQHRAQRRIVKPQVRFAVDIRPFHVFDRIDGKFRRILDVLQGGTLALFAAGRYGKFDFLIRPAALRFGIVPVFFSDNLVMRLEFFKKVFKL